MQQLLVGAILAALSGLSVVAVKYHAVYRNLYFKIIYATTTIYFCAASYSLGFIHSTIEWDKIILANNISLNDIKGKPINTLVDSPWTILIVLIALNLYLVFLDYLGNKINITNSQTTK